MKLVAIYKWTKRLAHPVYICFMILLFYYEIFKWARMQVIIFYVNKLLGKVIKMIIIFDMNITYVLAFFMM